MWQLTNEQLIKVSDIASQIGMIAFGSAVLPSVSQLKLAWTFVSLFFALLLWYWSLLIIKIAKED